MLEGAVFILTQKTIVNAVERANVPYVVFFSHLVEFDVPCSAPLLKRAAAKVTVPTLVKSLPLPDESVTSSSSCVERIAIYFNFLLYPQLVF